jgi:hypothetical protein
MIYEFRWYDIKPRMLGEYEQVVAKALAGGRTKYSPLFGYWYTEFGPLNQALHVWPYEDLKHRTEVRAQVANLGYWPPPSGPLLAAQKSEIFMPAPFNDEKVTGAVGPVYELRMYTYATGDISKVIDTWGKAITERRKHSTFVGCWFSELGGLNQWLHMWAYKSLEERARIRKEMADRKIWPPAGAPAPTRQENRLFLPFPFSPLK